MVCVRTKWRASFLSQYFKLQFCNMYTVLEPSKKIDFFQYHVSPNIVNDTI